MISKTLFGISLHSDAEFVYNFILILFPLYFMKVCKKRRRSVYINETKLFFKTV